MNDSRTESNASDHVEDHGHEGNGDATKLVPITESIRYRKRAQSAEKQAENVGKQLAEANDKIAELSQDVKSLQLDRQLTQKLVALGALDLEAAVLVAKARMADESEPDIDACVERLQREKGYLFGRSTEAAPSRKTAGAKERVTHSHTMLERAARKAARTASRADLQEYLRLRRSVL